MRILAAIGLSLVLAALEFASPAMAQDATRPPGIVGDDNRVPINSKEWPWSSIGRVNRSTGGFCTGVLIGPKQVLTVAHCLYDTRLQRWTSARDLHFVAGYSRGDFVAHMRVDDVAVSPNYDPMRPEDPANLVHDWAIVTVHESSDLRPIPWQMLDPRGSYELTASALVRAGYSQDRAHMLAGHQGCSVVSWEDDMMLHDCDGTRGDSGSPVLFQRFGQFTIVGLNVGFRVTDDAVLGLAVPAARFHDAARAAIGIR